MSYEGAPCASLAFVLSRSLLDCKSFSVRLLRCHSITNEGFGRCFSCFRAETPRLTNVLVFVETKATSKIMGFEIHGIFSQQRHPDITDFTHTHNTGVSHTLMSQSSTHAQNAQVSRTLMSPTPPTHITGQYRCIIYPGRFILIIDWSAEQAIPTAEEPCGNTQEQ